MLVDPANAMNTATTLRDVRSAARRGASRSGSQHRDRREIDAAWHILRLIPLDALLVDGGPLLPGGGASNSPNGGTPPPTRSLYRGVNTPRWVG